MENKKKAAGFAKLLLNETRDYIDSESFKPARLPDWINHARVVIGRRHRTTMFLFIPSGTQKDEFEYNGKISTLLELVTELPAQYKNDEEVTPPHPPDITSADEVPIYIQGKGRDTGKSPVVNVTTEDGSLFDVKSGHHRPVSVANFFFQLSSNNQPVCTGYIPFAVMFHDYDFENIPNLLDFYRQMISKYLGNIHDSEIGDYYERRGGESSTITTNKEESVIVLGDYDGGRHEAELVQVRNELEARGYYASLIKDLPAHPSQSLPQKVKMWCLTSRFVVLIDREPSGHIREYTELSKEDIPLALLRERGTGSTFMIGHEHHTDKYIESIEFDSTPNEVTNEVINWAEKFIDWLSNLHDDEYPWRNGT